jgi:hypothetical protein
LREKEMNSANDINGMSVNDLIYLFIDGEANDIEKSVLFTALSNNLYLQQEFQDALNIKNAAFMETSNLILPLSVTNSIFNKAGITNSIPTNVPFTQKISGLLSNTSLYSLGSGIIGALLTFFLINLTQNNNNNINNVLPSNKYTANKFNDTNVNHNIIIENDTKYPMRLSGISKAKKSNQDEVKHTDLQLGSLNNKENSVKQNSILISKLENNKTILVNKTININETKSLQQLIPNKNYYELKYENKKSDLTKSNILQGFTIMLNSINGLKYYPNRDNIVAQSVEINNLALTIKYKLDDTYSIGATVGKENYPLLIKDQSSALYPSSTLNFYGVNCDINLYDFDFAGYLSTDIRLLAGGSSVGFLGKSGIGFVWSPDSKLGFNFGLESTISVSSFNANADITGKLGLYYGISYKF